MKKIKIIGQDNVGWSIDKDHQNLRYFLSKTPGVILTESFIDADVYFFVWYVQVFHPKYILARVLRKLFKKKIIAWVTNDITQGDSFAKKHWPVDLWISPNEKISRFLAGQGLRHETVPFFASPEIFKKLGDDRKTLAEKLGTEFGILQDKILVGSFQRDSEGDDLLKPKWQKNPELLIEICKTFPLDGYVLVLAGPRRHYLITRCKAENIPYAFVGDASVFDKKADDIMLNNLDQEMMSMLYNLVDLYIVTSKSEGGPKAVLEASLSKTLVCSTDVGFAREFLHPDLLYGPENLGPVTRIFDQIANGHTEIMDNYRAYNYSEVQAKLSLDSYKSLVEKAVQSSE